MSFRRRIGPHLVAPLLFLTTCAWYFSTHDPGADNLRAVELALFGPLQSPVGFLLAAAFYPLFVAATVFPQAFTIGAFVLLGLPAWYLGTLTAMGA